MNTIREEHDTPKNTNIIGRKGHGKKGDNRGWVTYIQEHIARVEAKASASGDYSHRMASKRRVESQPPEHIVRFV